MKIFNRYQIVLLFLPIVIFLFKSGKYLAFIIATNGTSDLYKSICHIIPYFNDFILSEIILFAVLYAIEKRLILKTILLQNLTIVLVGILLFLIKGYMLYTADISLDIVYFIKIILSILIELSPLIIIKIYKKNTTIWNMIYITIIILILILNISIASYFYFTSETIEPIIFSNLNMVSFRGFFIDISFINVILITSGLLFFISLVYFLATRVEMLKVDRKKYLINLLVFSLLLFLSYKVVFYTDKYTLRKGCSVYGTTKFTKDLLTDKITKSSIYALMDAYWNYKHLTIRKKPQNNIVLTDVEKHLLNKIGLITDKTNNTFHKKYNRIIFIVIESLSIDFLHTYNKNIPEESSYYLDYLLENNFHLNNFYTTNMPTDYGITALFKSKIDLNIDSKSLYEILQKNGYQGYYMVAISKFYGLMSTYYPKAFRFQHYINSETLKKEYGNKESGWGFHDDILFDKAFNILKDNNNSKIFLTIKEIDFHQPGSYCGYNKLDLPNSIQESDKIIQSMYWINKQIEQFIEKLKKYDLFDDKTLIVITGDHNPHMGSYFKKYALDDNYQVLARIPLILVTKNNDFNDFNSLQNNLYSQIDLAPTITSILDIGSNKDFMGNNIFIKDRDAYSILGKYKENLYYRNKDDLRLININKSHDNNLTIKSIMHFYQNN